MISAEYRANPKKSDEARSFPEQVSGDQINQHGSQGSHAELNHVNKIKVSPGNEVKRSEEILVQGGKRVIGSAGHPVSPGESGGPLVKIEMVERLRKRVEERIILQVQKVKHANRQREKKQRPEEGE